MKLVQDCVASCLTIVAVAVVLAGCTGETKKRDTGQGTKAAVHLHPTEGPHHGALIELGNEEYHAELVHDETSLTIYILNSAADKQVPIEAMEVAVNIKLDGKPKQFKLAASPDKGDPSGKSSRFVSNDAELAANIDKDGGEPRLALTIAGKSYRGAMVHDDGHKH